MRLSEEEAKALQDSLINLSKQQQTQIENTHGVNLNKLFNKLAAIADENSST